MRSPLAPGMTVNRRVGVKVVDVECPSCHAGPGSQCLGEGDLPISLFHKPRRSAATRQAATTIDRAAAEYAASLSEVQRRRVRLAFKLSIKDAAHFFGVGEKSFRDMERGTRRIYDLHAAAYGAWLRVHLEGARR